LTQPLSHADKLSPLTREQECGPSHRSFS